MTKRLLSIITSVKIGDINNRDIYRYILISRLLQRLENYDTTAEDDAQEFSFDSYLQIQNILNVYLNTNITYNEFIYNK